MVVRRVFAVGFTAALLTVVGAAGASAGEVKGNGDPITVNGNSICAYSGQNDGYHDPAHAESEEDAAQRVQSFGQEVRKIAAYGMVDDFARGLVEDLGRKGVGIPGLECNGHTNPWPPTP